MAENWKTGVLENSSDRVESCWKQGLKWDLTGWATLMSGVARKNVSPQNKLICSVSFSGLVFFVDRQCDQLTFL